MDRDKRTGRFLKGNKVAKKAIRRCLYCGDDITDMRKGAIFCSPSCGVMMHRKIKRYKAVTLNKTVNVSV